MESGREQLVNSIAVQADGKILLGGYFTTIGGTMGQTRNLFARLSNDTPPLQNFAATPTSVTWTRGGSSPQFTRVTFESSTDNVSYSFLGNATATGNNWTLTGLNFIQDTTFTSARAAIIAAARIMALRAPMNQSGISFSPCRLRRQPLSREKSMAAQGFSTSTYHLAGNTGIECRSGGAGNDYQIVFSFPNSVTLTNTAVTAGAGSVSGSSGSGTSTISVNLTGVTNAQRLTLTLFGASDGTNTGNLSVQMGMLLGDTNGNGTVNATDVSQAKAQSGNPVTASNFREDVNTNGAINASDISAVKTKSGTALP